MRTFLIIALLFLSIGMKGQVISELSFDNKTKTVSLSLTSQFEQLLALFPPSDDSREEIKGTYFAIKYKDIKGEVLRSRSIYVFINRSGPRWLVPKKCQTYTLDLTTMFNSEKIDSVEIQAHIEARSMRTVFIKEDIYRTYKWQ